MLVEVCAVVNACMRQSSWRAEGSQSVSSCHHNTNCKSLHCPLMARTMQLRTGSGDIESEPPVLEPRFATGSKLRGESVVADMRWALCSLMSNRSWQSHHFFFVDGIACGGARIPQGTTTVPRGGSCRVLSSATSMTVAMVLGGRAKFSRRASSLGKSSVWRWAWACRTWWRSRAPRSR